MSLSPHWNVIWSKTEPSHGFLSKSSTNHAIIELVDKITKTIEHKFTVGLVLDLPKAFDTVNHNIHWLYFYGFRGKFHAWIKNYLSNRKQIGKYKRRSTEKKVTCGVPQGSILGPLVLLKYINDLNNSTSKLYTILFTWFRKRQGRTFRKVMGQGGGATKCPKKFMHAE